MPRFRPVTARLFERAKRQIQAPWLRRERHEAVSLAEGASAVVQRIEHDGTDADRVTSADDPVDRIEQQSLAEPAPFTVKIDGQPPDDSRQYGIMQQVSANFRRQIVLFDARCAQCLVTGDPHGRLAGCDEDPHDTLSGVLGGPSLIRTDMQHVRAPTPWHNVH